MGTGNIPISTEQCTALCTVLQCTHEQSYVVFQLLKRTNLMRIMRLCRQEPMENVDNVIYLIGHKVFSSTVSTSGAATVSATSDAKVITRSVSLSSLRTPLCIISLRDIV